MLYLLKIEGKFVFGLLKSRVFSKFCLRVVGFCTGFGAFRPIFAINLVEFGATTADLYFGHPESLWILRNFASRLGLRAID